MISVSQAEMKSKMSLELLVVGSLRCCQVDLPLQREIHVTAPVGTLPFRCACGRGCGRTFSRKQKQFLEKGSCDILCCYTPTLALGRWSGITMATIYSNPLAIACISVPTPLPC